MSNCIFIKGDKDGQWVCTECSYRTYVGIFYKTPPIRQCPGISVETKYPSTIGLAKNFTKAMVGYAQSGFAHVTTEQYKDRLAICQDNCPNYDGGRCKHPECGCFLPAKAWIKNEKCPLDKWPKLD